MNLEANVSRVCGIVPKENCSFLSANGYSSIRNAASLKKADGTQKTINCPSPSDPVSIETLYNNSEEFEALAMECLEGMNVYPPELCEEGVNGTYFLKNVEGDIIAVFKPVDEEGDSKNNPKNSPSLGHPAVNAGAAGGVTLSGNVRNRTPSFPRKGSFNFRYNQAMQDPVQSPKLRAKQNGSNRFNKPAASPLLIRHLKEQVKNSISMVTNTFTPKINRRRSSQKMEDRSQSLIQSLDLSTSPVGARRSSSKLSISTEGTSSNTILEYGESSKREVAAFLLDTSQSHYYGVPLTGLVNIHVHNGAFDQTNGHCEISSPSNKKKDNEHCRCCISKSGSLQAFVHSEGQAWDFGASLFPVKEVHKIGILDLQLYNADRHGGNILAQRKATLDRRHSIAASFPFSSKTRLPPSATYQLVPIDHGYSLPHRPIDKIWFDWITWPQAKKPFDEETKQFIASIDAKTNANILATELGIPSDSLRIMKLGTYILKKGAAVGMTLFEIASLFVRKCEGDPEPSFFERLYWKANRELFATPQGSSPSSSPSVDRENLYDSIIDRLCDEEITSSH